MNVQVSNIKICPGYIYDIDDFIDAEADDFRISNIYNSCEFNMKFQDGILTVTIIADDAELINVSMKAETENIREFMSEHWQSIYNPLGLSDHESSLSED